MARRVGRPFSDVAFTSRGNRRSNDGTFLGLTEGHSSVLAPDAGLFFSPVEFGELFAETDEEEKSSYFSA